MADAASTLIAELLGEAFLDSVARSGGPSAARAREVWRWLQQIAEPPPGLELVAPDGATYTGLVVVVRSRAVLLLALHHPPRASRDHYPVPRGNEESPFDDHGLFDDRPWLERDRYPFRR